MTPILIQILKRNLKATLCPGVHYLRAKDISKPNLYNPY